MNKLLLSVILLLAFGGFGYSQTNSGQLKFSDIVSQYRAQHPDKHAESTKPGHTISTEESDDSEFQFNRWKWYWEKHLDANGYLMPEMQTWNEWRSYLSKTAQKNKGARTTGSNASNWSFQGRDSTGASNAYSDIGRINCIAFDPVDTNILWAGVAGGGAWKTTDNAKTWHCMTDDLPTVGISSIAINPMNPNTIYLCTGDFNSFIFDASTYGVGILKSTNGGLTWDTTTIHWNEDSAGIYGTGLSIRQMLINPKDSNCMFLATNLGIYKSINGGKTWHQTSSGGNRLQILYKPGDTSILYSTSLYAGYGEILRSTNGGDTWMRSDSLYGHKPIVLAVTPADPKIVKALATTASKLDYLYASSDTGKTFRNVSWLGAYASQGVYDVCLAVSPTDTNLIFAGGVQAVYSTDGGNTWNLRAGNLHADKHFLAYHPNKTGELYETNDGGAGRSTNPATGAWQDITHGIEATQYYKMAVSSNASFVLGGAQDNGTFKIYGHNSSLQVGGADGMVCRIDYADSTVIYASSQYGNIYRNAMLISPTTTSTWIIPYVLSPTCHTCLYAGYGSTLYMSNSMGSSWTPVSVPGVISISNIGLTAADPNTIYVTGLYGDSIFCSHNNGSSWTVLDPPYTHPVQNNGIVSCILADPSNKNHFWITYQGFASVRVAEYDSATGWKNLTGTLPQLPVNCIIMDTSTGNLYIGTDASVFYRSPTMSDWQLYNNNLPTVMVTDMGINYTTGLLWAATFGKGIWRSPIQKNNSVPINATTTNSTLYPNPNDGGFVFSAGNSFMNKRVSMRLINEAGRTVWESISKFDDAGKVQINSAGLVKGVYFFEAATDNSVIAHRQVVVW
jgi:hypothetical protein